jgi:hypothetical protein
MEEFMKLALVLILISMTQLQTGIAREIYYAPNGTYGSV